MNKKKPRKRRGSTGSEGEVMLMKGGHFTLTRFIPLTNEVEILSAERLKTPYGLPTGHLIAFYPYCQALSTEERKYIYLHDSS